MTTTPTTSQVLAGPAVGASSPAAPTFRQLNGQDIATPSGTLSVSATPTHDVALTAGTRVYTMDTSTGKAFTVTGFTGGVDGAVIYIYNLSGQNMTLSHQTGSSAANQIITSTGGNVSTTGNGMFTLVYIAGTVNKWVLMSTSL